MADYSDSETELMNNIYGLLKNNSARWFKSKEIQQRFDVSGAKVRSAVHNIREEAYPIISTSKGYKFAESADEISGCLAHMYSRVQSIISATKGLVKARKRMGGSQIGFSFQQVERLDSTITQGAREYKADGQ